MLIFPINSIIFRSLFQYCIAMHRLGLNCLAKPALINFRLGIKSFFAFYVRLKFVENICPVFFYFLSRIFYGPKKRVNQPNVLALLLDKSSLCRKARVQETIIRNTCDLLKVYFCVHLLKLGKFAS